MREKQRLTEQNSFLEWKLHMAMSEHGRKHGMEDNSEDTETTADETGLTLSPTMAPSYDSDSLVNWVAEDDLEASCAWQDEIGKCAVAE